MRYAALLLCAWVLWANQLLDHETVARGKWQPQQGFQTAEACARAQAAQNAPGWIHRCLPDTVDPRGAK